LGPLTTIQPSIQPGVRPASRRFSGPLLLGFLRRTLLRLSTRIDEHPRWAFAALTAGYAAAVLALSSMKLLWLDELITLHIAQLGSVKAIWQALAQGADPNPPLTHLLVLGSMKLFGVHEWALRLPAMVGYWVGMAALFAFLRRRVSATWALAGTVLSMSMAAYDYAYESRSYAIFYGLAMLAFYCWSRAVDRRNDMRASWVALCGMTAALALGVCTNYFAVLAFLPIAGGEIARTLYAARMERWPGGGLGGWKGIARAAAPRVWVAMVLAALPLLAFRGMIAHSIAEFGPHAWNKVSLDQVTDSYTQMVEIVLYPLLALLAFTGLVLALSRFCEQCRRKLRPRWVRSLAAEQAMRGGSVLPVHEATGVLLLMAYPILGYMVASIHGGMMSPRFVIPVCFGFAIAGVLAAFRLFGHVRTAGAIALCLCVAWFVARESYVGYSYNEQKESFYKVIAHLPGGDLANAPIVIADPLMVLTFQHYAPASLVKRVVFPVDFPAVRFYRGDDSAEENLWAGRDTIYHLPVVPLAGWQRNAGKYVIVASDGNWLVEDLLHHRYPVYRLPINTRAGMIGGFTPLNHGYPVYWVSAGDGFFRNHPEFHMKPMQFSEKENLPTGKLPKAEGVPFWR
jgi:4-amino-4-deoxy-L-arabinose transferase-like glycosyltransferase